MPECRLVDDRAKTRPETKTNTRLRAVLRPCIPTPQNGRARFGSSLRTARQPATYPIHFTAMRIPGCWFKLSKCRKGQLLVMEMTVVD